MDQLANFVVHGGTSDRQTYPTPTQCSHQNPGDHGQGGQNLVTEVTRRPDGTTPTTGQLNPDWVEFLMNWPIGWTRLSPIKLDWRTWDTDPADTGEIPRVATGIKNRVNRLKAIGNGQVPAAMVLAWEILTEENQ